jgi:ABC-type ATPase with predicted acetyltransferase domain
MVCISSGARRTPALLRACAMFGLRLKPSAARAARMRMEAEELLAALAGGGVGLIVGPSGAGKSTLLRAAGRAASSRARRMRVIRAQAVEVDAGCSALEAIARVRPPGGLRGALSCLAAAGLADALVLPRVVGELSEGQRARLAFAVAIARAERALHRGCDVLVMADEFATMLDRASAMSMCITVTRWARRHCRRERLTVLMASGHEDLRRWLAADVVAEVSSAGVVACEAKGV